MDVAPPPTTAVATVTSSAAAAAVKTPDPDTETPTRIQSNSIPKQLPPPLTNGVLKRHKPLHHHHHHPPAPVVVTYKECLKNHAATMGGHAVDGCGEFMPSPTSSPSYPTSLKCAACGCHRNFHRREPDESSPYLNTPPIQHVIEYQPHHRHHPPPPPPALPPPSGSPGNSPSPPPISSSYYPSAPHMLLALSTGLSSPPAENNHHHPSVATTPGSGAVASGSNPNGKKRFRTKFTQDQKEKMQEIAERVGWKMQKRDKELIVGFCNQIGVDKGVFKVWMHNNKSTTGNQKKDFTGNNGNSSGDGIDFIISRNSLHPHNHHDAGNNHLHPNNHNNDSFSTGGNVICTNGSSSSS